MVDLKLNLKLPVRSGGVSKHKVNPSKTHWKKMTGSNKVLTNPKYKKQTGYTLKSFMENNPVGRFVLIVQGHAVAVVNGVLYANTNENAIGLYRSVWFGWNCK
jgi:hypothetical protein